MAITRRKFTKEFKEATVKRWRDEALSCTALSKELGISTGVLSNWRSAIEGKRLAGKKKAAKKKAKLKITINPLPHVKSDVVVYLQLAKEAMIPGKLTRADLFSLIALSLIENGQ